MSNLANMTASALVSLYNDEIIDAYAPSGFAAVSGFKNKASAIERIEAACAAGNLAIAFDGDKALVVDAMSGDDAAGDDAAGDDAAGDDAAGDDAAGDDAVDAFGTHIVDGIAYGDGKGAVQPNGFRKASAAWLAANPRGTKAREAYRDMRRKGPRMARKAKRGGIDVTGDAFAAAVAAAVAAELAKRESADAE
jgi:hypothetical protein